jgi:hypothetical protein
VIEGNLGRVRTTFEDDSAARSRCRSWAARRHADRGHPEPYHVINMPPDLMGTGDHFALEVRGDPMIEAGILDGDTALIKKTDAVDTGDIVVALIDERPPQRFAGAAPRSRSSRQHRIRCGYRRLTGCAFRASWSAVPGGHRDPNLRARAGIERLRAG